MQLASRPAFPEPLLAAMWQLSENPRLGFRLRGSTLHQGFGAGKYLIGIGDTASVVRYAWLESLKAQQQSANNTDVMLMSNHATPQPSKVNNVGDAEVEWHIVPQANNISDPQLSQKSMDATAEKYSQSSILLDESRRTKPAWHWEGSHTGGGLDAFDRSALPANQKWYINTGGGNNSSNQRIQAVVGMKPDGTLIKAWTVHVEWGRNGPVYSKID